jgi:NAD(P) transhydrogenase subunit alpha
VIEAAALFPKAFPMFMTAAGTVAPARVFVMGAGVAGLQAIATAKRLGAIVSATDVRAVAKEQVESLGASFVMVEDEEAKAAETSGGYAKEMSDDYKKKQAALVADHIAKQDIVITTALIPGRAAPELVTEDMVKSMKSGSVIVDLAAVQGGNCKLTERDHVIEKHGVKLVGYTNLPAHIAQDASSLYARNVQNFLMLITDARGPVLNLNWDDDIIKGCGLTSGGQKINPNFGGIPLIVSSDKVA